MILDTIRERLPEMRSNSRKIGTYILDNQHNAAFASIHEVSAAVGLSSASLVRFARNLGLDGYQSFKKELQDEIRHRLSPDDKIAFYKLDSLPEEQQVKKLFENEMNNLKGTLGSLKLEELERMVQGIRAARKIFICGFGLTTYFVRIFETTLLNSLDKDVIVISGSVSDYAPQLKSFTSEDAMFILTFPPYSLEVRHVAETVKERGGSLYLITDSASCPVYHLAQTAITCVTNSMLLSNSFVGLLSILHILVHLVYLDATEAAAESRRTTLRIQERGYEFIGAAVRGA